MFQNIVPWSNLWDTASEKPPTDLQEDTASSQPSQAILVPDAPPGVHPAPDLNLSREAMMLALDVVPYPFDGCNERLKRLNLSSRKFEEAKRELEERTFCKIIKLGQTLYLVPTDKFFQAFGLEPPKQKRLLALEHGFAIRLAAHLLRQDPLVRWVDIEVPLGDSGATVDLGVHRKDGSREAYEVTLSVGNISANAAKLQDKGFAKIVFVCRDTSIRQAAWARLQQSGLAPDLLGRCRVVLFSALAKRIKQIGR